MRIAATVLVTAVIAGFASAGAKTVALDRAFLRSTHPALGDDDFARKWQASLESPVIFIRSYPAAFHRLLAYAPAPIGVVGLCFGDAHPGNFGFLLTGGKTRFAYNDLDDSGYCPIANDALRYFTALRMFFDDEGLTRDVLETYVDVVKDRGRAEAIRKGYAPKWKKVRAEGLAKHTNGNRLAGSELAPVTAAERAAVVAALRGDPRAVLDVAAVAREMGGSGGLRRYWILLARAEGRTILELKQATTPGVDWGRRSRTLPFARRLAVLKAAFWGTRTQEDYYYVALAKKPFLARDRFTKKSLKVEELGGKDRKHVLKAQASYMAVLHSKAWDGVKKDDLRAWLWRESASQAALWRGAYEGGRRER